MRYLRAYTLTLGALLLINSLLPMRGILKSPKRGAPSSSSSGEQCRQLRDAVARRADRHALRQGGAYTCNECQLAMAAGVDEQLRSCSMCGTAVENPRRPPAGSPPLLEAEQLPSVSGIEWRVPAAQLPSWFVHQGNALSLGHLNISEALPPTALQALQELEARHRWGRCAVVGSGGSMWRSGLGRAVDSHDLVLRINQAPCVGYEKHVGVRTDIRMLNNRWTYKYSQDKRSPLTATASGSMPLEEGATLLVTRADDDDLLNLHRNLVTGRPDVQLRLLSSRVVSAVRNRLLAPYRSRLNASCVEPLLWSVAEGRDTPSSGLVAVFIMLHMCREVTVFGFSGSNDGKRYHYFKGNRNYMNRTHSFSAERALLRALARDGVIRFEEGNLDYVVAGVRRAGHL